MLPKVDLDFCLNSEVVYAVAHNPIDADSIAAIYKELSFESKDISERVIAGVMKGIQTDNASVFPNYFKILDALLDISDSLYRLSFPFISIRIYQISLLNHLTSFNSLSS